MKNTICALDIGTLSTDISVEGDYHLTGTVCVALKAEVRFGFELAYFA